jgi:hypothetical protein
MNSGSPPLLLDPLPLPSPLPVDVAPDVPLPVEPPSRPVEAESPSLPVSGGPEEGSVEADVPPVGDVAVDAVVAEPDIVDDVVPPPVSPAPTVPSSLHATNITNATHPRCKRFMGKAYQSRASIWAWKCVRACS